MVSCVCEWTLCSLLPPLEWVNYGGLLARHSITNRTRAQIHSARESALFFSTGGVVAWALGRIELDWRPQQPMRRQLGSPRRDAGQSARSLGVPPIQTLRGAIGWKLNRDGISQSEPVSTGCELLARERRGGAGTQPLHRPLQSSNSNDLISETGYISFLNMHGSDIVSGFPWLLFWKPHRRFFTSRQYSRLELNIVTASQKGNFLSS